MRRHPPPPHHHQQQLHRQASDRKTEIGGVVNIDETFTRDQGRSRPRDYAVPLGLGLPICPDPDKKKVLVGSRPQQLGDGFVTVAVPTTVGASIASTRTGSNGEPVAPSVLHLEILPRRSRREANVQMPGMGDFATPASAVASVEGNYLQNISGTETDRYYGQRQRRGIEQRLCSMHAMAGYFFCGLIILCALIFGLKSTLDE